MTTTIDKPKRGRRAVVFTNFPPATDWTMPSHRLAQNLGLCWKTADRIRTEALMAASRKPVIPVQLDLPGVEGPTHELIGCAGVDWSANASLLATHLSLDKAEVSRLKLLSHRRNRRRK